MKSLKPGTKYQSVSLTVDLIDEIKDHIKGSPIYRSVADYVRYAIIVTMKKQKDEIKIGEKPFKPVSSTDERLRLIEENQAMLIQLLKEKKESKDIKGNNTHGLS